MRRFLLDTSPLAALLRNRLATVARIRPWLDRHEVATSILVYGEVTEYLKSLPDYARRQAELRRFLREIYPYALTYSILERYADIRRQAAATTWSRADRRHRYVDCCDGAGA